MSSKFYRPKALLIFFTSHWFVSLPPINPAKLKKKTLGNTILDIGLGKNFMTETPRAIANKNHKIDK